MKNCIICEARLEEEDVKEHRLTLWNILYDGIVFKSIGNFGSSEYDPMDSSEYLEIAICDKCLSSKGHLIKRYEETKPKKEVEYQFIENFVQYKKRLASKDYVGRGKKAKKKSR